MYFENNEDEEEIDTKVKKVFTNKHNSTKTLTTIKIYKDRAKKEFSWTFLWGSRNNLENSRDIGFYCFFVWENY